MEKESYAVENRPQPAQLGVVAQSSADGSSSSPTILIKPFNSWFAIEWRSIWNYRELLYFLIWRDVKVRYKQTFLGIAWVALQPLVTTLIFTVLFSRFNIERQSAVSYSLLIFVGFVFWSFVNTAVNNSSNSLVNYTHLITKVYFPRLLVPVAAVGSSLADFAINLVLFFVITAFFGVVISWKLLLVPFLVLLVVFLVLGIGITLSAFNVLFRDVRQILFFGLQVWMFLSPVFYTLDLVPERWRLIWKFNPLTGILENFRAAVFNLDLDWTSLAISAAVTLIIFASSLYIFNRLENDFADVI